MSELIRITHEEPLESTPDTTNQSHPNETGFMLLEQENSFEKSNIDTLQQKAGELRNIDEVQRGLELSIIGSGLQAMTDRYGADNLLNTMQGSNSFQEVISTLAPDKAERKELYEAIEAEPMESIAQQLDETLGGIAHGNSTVSGMERFRSAEIIRIQGKESSGSIISRYNNKEGYTDSANLLLTGGLNDLLAKHPDLAENFRESNDTVTLLKDIRSIYEAEFAQFSSDLEQAKNTVQEKIASGEASIIETQTLIEDIYGNEIVELEKKLATTSNEDTRAMLEDMLNKKAVEVTASREDFKVKMDTVRNTIITNLDAERLNQLHPEPPIDTEPIYNDK